MSSCLFECLKEAGLERIHSSLQRRGYDTAFSLLYLPPAELQDVGVVTDLDRQRFLQLVQIIASFHQGGELSPERMVSPKRSPDSTASRRHPEGRKKMTNSRKHDFHHQSSESSTASEESPPGYVPSPRRKQQGLSGDNTTNNRGRPQAKRKTSSNTIPKSNNRNLQSQRRNNCGNDFNVADVNNISSCSEGDNNVLQPERGRALHPSHRLVPNLPLPSTIGEDSAEDISSATKNIRMSAELLKVQRVMRTKGYNYGLPRDGHRQNGAIGLTPRTKSKTPLRTSTPGLQNQRDGTTSTQAKQRITVCVRQRPMLEAERQAGGFHVITCNKEDGGRDGGLVVHELKHTVDMAEYIQQNVFQFDKVFAERAGNRDIYEGAVKPMVDWIMNRTNRATCFGYGQTGAGKTHTLLGNDAEWGVFFHAANDILLRLSGKVNRGRRGFGLEVSLYEIYCSRIFDLLNDHKRLQALEDNNKQIHIHGLKSVPVKNMASLQEVLEQGLGVRSVGVTGANQDSSRSHAIVQLSVKDSAGAEFSRLSFIDLAGSERARDALRDSDKQNRLEGAEINQSLLALKECIRSLDLALAHTPFRQSKLTQVLRDSFVGNSKTCMIANVSPSHSNLEHTMNTLRYASRVKELHRKAGFSTPRQQRKSSYATLSARRRPFTADPTYSKSKPGKSSSPKIRSQVSRSVSIDSGTRVADYTPAFTGRGRELARTPPPTTHSVDALIEVHAAEPAGDFQAPVERVQNPPEDCHVVPTENSESTPVHSERPITGREIRSVPLRRTQSIFTPDSVAASSTPNKTQENKVKKSAKDEEISTKNVVTSNSDSSPVSTPRFLKDTEPVGGLSSGILISKSDDSEEKKSRESSLQNTQSHPDSLTVESTASSHGTRSAKEESASSSSSVTAEHGSSKENKNDIASETDSEMSTEKQTDNAGNSVSAIPDQSRRSSRGSSDSESKLSDGSLSSAAAMSVNSKSLALPSPKKFLTYLKDKHSIKTKALKQQLRKARCGEKNDRQGSEEDHQSSDQCHSLPGPAVVTNTVSYSTSRDNLTSNVQQHHQKISLQADASPVTSLQSYFTPIPTAATTNAQTTPPRLPSPKLGRSQPRRSSRMSSRSSSPGTGGRTTPVERTLVASSISNQSTTKGLTSASELRARLVAAAARNSNSDSDDSKTSRSENPLTSTIRNTATTKGSGTLSSSDKENSNAASKDKYVHRAQNEVIIAHQEHISDILRISIEEERLYHELRDQWEKGTSFECYTKSLRKLLARKTQSIEALKVQLALYDRVCNAPK